MAPPESEREASCERWGRDSLRDSLLEGRDEVLSKLLSTPGVALSLLEREERDLRREERLSEESLLLSRRRRRRRREEREPP